MCEMQQRRKFKSVQKWHLFAFKPQYFKDILFITERLLCEAQQTRKYKVHKSGAFFQIPMRFWGEESTDRRTIIAQTKFYTVWFELLKKKKLREKIFNSNSEGFPIITSLKTPAASEIILASKHLREILQDFHLWICLIF